MQLNKNIIIHGAVLVSLVAISVYCTLEFMKPSHKGQAIMENFLARQDVAAKINASCLDVKRYAEELKTLIASQTGVVLPGSDWMSGVFCPQKEEIIYQ